MLQLKCSESAIQIQDYLTNNKKKHYYPLEVSVFENTTRDPVT